METLNQKEAAEFLGISDSYLSKILSGKSIPRPKIIKKLTKITKSDSNIWLFGDRVQKENSIKQALSNNNEAA
ncbi:MAG: helix-turn-helix transcriptional regulator [Deltaproteobacteria bacterium]|nr:helix-turn-helix transcriptional regulator [Deltaproteobacteria bacterium]